MGGLAPAETAKLREVVGLFDSDNACEATAAFHAAYALASRRGVRMTEGLEQLFAPAPIALPRAKPEPAPARPSERQLIACLDLLRTYTSWERDFLAGINGRSRLSPAQHTMLNKLHSMALGYLATEIHDAD